jgi:endonuclease YncB( thermonuclease family)
VDCPEVKGSTKKAGDAATEATRRWVKSHSGLVIRTLKTKKQADSFGRYLVEVFGDTDGKQESLNQYLLDEGFAVPYRE